MAFDRLWQESAAGAPSGNLWGDGTILQIAARLLMLKSGCEALPPAEDRRLPETRLRRAAEVLRSELACDIGLAKVASAAGMSAFHFSRQFRAMFGASPHQYRITAQIEAAQHLLRTTRLPLAEIAHRVGHEDLSRFGQHFKARIGVTPAAWRAS